MSDRHTSLVETAHCGGNDHHAAGEPMATRFAALPKTHSAPQPHFRQPIQQSWEFASSAATGATDPRTFHTNRASADRARRWNAANQFGGGGNGLHRTGRPGSGHTYTRDYFEAKQAEGRARLANAVIQGHRQQCSRLA